MTTNAIDLRSKVIACDTRWSIEQDEWFVFVDDTGFDKMVCRPIASIVCAGDAILIEQWRNWFIEPVLDFANMPMTNRTGHAGLYDITISVIRAYSGTVIYQAGQYLDFEQHAYFSGSGSPYALDCFSTNRCSRRCVRSASELDHRTGGTIQFVELSTNAHNLSDEWVGLSEVKNQFLSRGKAMNTTTKKVIPISDFTGPAADQIKSRLRGELAISAPTGHPPKQWTDEEREKLRQVFKDLAEEEDVLRRK